MPLKRESRERIDPPTIQSSAKMRRRDCGRGTWGQLDHADIDERAFNYQMMNHTCLSAIARQISDCRWRRNNRISPGDCVMYRLTGEFKPQLGRNAKEVQWDAVPGRKFLGRRAE